MSGHMLPVKVNQSCLVSPLLLQFHSKFSEFLEVFGKKRNYLVIVDRHKLTHGDLDLCKQRDLSRTFFAWHVWDIIATRARPPPRSTRNYPTTPESAYQILNMLLASLAALEAAAGNNGARR